jgi:hypothetical protein
MINATGRKPIPPMIIIQGKRLMQKWFHKSLPIGTYIKESENGFTDNQIAVLYLQHYICNSDCGPSKPWKLMLMDNHKSHETPEFINLANANHILPFPLIPHLTHCMQPLDVGIFQPYKHYHDLAIKNALSRLDLEYTICSFLGDLSSIRDETFSRYNIKKAWKKSGMYPIDCNRCLKNLKTFTPPENKPQTVEEPLLPRTPKKPIQVEESTWR